MKQLNNKLTDRANDSQVGLEPQQQKQEGGREREREKRGRVDAALQDPGLGTTTLSQCTHYTNAVIRKQKKNMVMKQLVF